MGEVPRRIWTEQLLRYGKNSDHRVCRVCVEFCDGLNVELGRAQARLAFSWFVLDHGGRQRFASSIVVDAVHRIGPRIASLRYPVIASRRSETHSLPTFAHRLPTALIRGRRMARILLHYNIDQAQICWFLPLADFPRP